MSHSHQRGESPPRRRHPRVRHATKGLALLIGLYLAAAYLIVPWAWERYADRHPSFDDNPRITTTGDGHPGDPLNVAIIGAEDQIRDAMRAADWLPAAALGLRSDLKIVADTVLSRPDDEAPVSTLYLFGRKEDLAFEHPVGDNPRQRHHVRFWKLAHSDGEGRPIWIGSAAYDKRVGFSHTTGQFTHHIAANIDAERDFLLDGLRKAGNLSEDYAVDGFHKTLTGRNGGGDPWRTDGRLFVGVVSETAKPSETAK